MDFNIHQPRRLRSPDNPVIKRPTKEVREDCDNVKAKHDDF